jgi:hypothetical protein
LLLELLEQLLGFRRLPSDEPGLVRIEKTL